ncbi:MAG: glycosyltransferase family 39 protein [Bacteroidetes bacterium]|nr:glycosyltransferase family 39 protein [Bacteroidota bacterium]
MRLTLKLALAASFLALITILAWGLANKKTRYFDDVATLLTNNGASTQIHEHWKNAITTPNWKTAQYWQEVFHKTERFNYQAVSYKLTTRDIHPPLYFWLGHTWQSIFGFGYWSLVVFQFILFAVFILLLGKWLNTLSERPKPWAYLLTILACFHPTFLDLFFCLRHYVLLGILMLGFILSDKRLNHKFSIKHLLFWDACILGGLLTHYYFGLFLACWFLVELLEKKFNRTSLMHAAMALTTTVFCVVVFQDFFSSLLRPKTQMGHGVDVNYAFGLPFRWFLPNRVFKLLPIWVCLTAWPLAFTIFIFLRKKLKGIAKKAVFSVLIFGVFTSLLGYLGKLPPHSFTENRYHIVVLMVLLPVLLTLIANGLPKLKWLLVAYSMGYLAFNFMYLRTQPINWPTNNKLIVISKYQPDFYNLVMNLSNSQEVLLLKAPSQLAKLDLTNALILTEKRITISELEKANLHLTEKGEFYNFSVFEILK